jgi:hypothetical protein
VAALVIAFTARRSITARSAAALVYAFMASRSPFARKAVAVQPTAFMARINSFVWMDAGAQGSALTESKNNFAKKALEV